MKYALFYPAIRSYIFRGSRGIRSYTMSCSCSLLLSVRGNSWAEL